VASRWALTRTAFLRLLLRLDPDPDHAGQKYEDLRRRLVGFFELRGSSCPEDHADETINRVTRRIDEGQPVEHLVAYAHGVARMILLEALRREEKERATEEAFAIATLTVNGSSDLRWACLDCCLDALPADDRELMLAYYRYEAGRKIEARKTLAGRLGIPSGVLRARAFRIRERLEVCVRRCVGRAQRGEHAPCGDGSAVPPVRTLCRR
jgi:DNA-directed RNA polymerase specialized sigma24 family protein